MRDYKKYDIWNLSHSLVKYIYQMTKDYPKEELFGLVSQIRRAATSIPTNIAEGCGRNTDKEFARFLYISIGSINETEYLLFLSSELNLISEETFLECSKQLNAIRRKTFQLRKKLIEI